jgi:hypothetical protein
VALPNLRLLAYHEQKPMLRIVRLPGAKIEPAPVSLDTGYAIDKCLRRDGWIAFSPPNFEAWGISTTFDEPPFLIARDTWWVSPARDPRCVWLSPREEPLVTKYDGVARSTVLQLEWPMRMAHPIGEVDDRLLYHDDDGLFAWRGNSRPQPLLAGVRPIALDPTGRTVVCLRWETKEFVLYDVDTMSHISVPQPEGGRWPDPDFRAAFSPDGTWLAVDIDYSTEHPDEEAHLADLLRDDYTYEFQTHRLGIIRCADGAMTIAEGEYDNFANLVWTLDSERVVFSTPFAPQELWIARPATAKLERIDFAQGAPSLLCDVSDLIPV